MKEEEEDATYVAHVMTLTEVIISILEEAGAEGLTVKEIVQLIKERKLWEWKKGNGYNSVYTICGDSFDTILRVAPGTYALEELQDGTRTYVKPLTLKEVINSLLEEAGAKGLTLKEMVQLIKERGLWDLKEGRKGYEAVRDACCNSRDRSLFVRVAPGTYVLQSFYDQHKAYEQPVTLKEAIIELLEEAGADGLTVKEMVDMLEDRGMWDWKDVKRPSESVRKRCSESAGIFIKVTPGTYALQSLFKGKSVVDKELRSKKLAKKTDRRIRNSINYATSDTETCDEDGKQGKESNDQQATAPPAVASSPKAPKNPGKKSGIKRARKSPNPKSSSSSSNQSRKKKKRAKVAEEFVDDPVAVANDLMFLNTNTAAIGAS
jgi:chromosome segregation and condensation protein ScpB